MKLLSRPWRAGDEMALGRFGMLAPAQALNRPASRRVGVALATLALAGILPLLLISTVLVAVLAHDQRQASEDMATEHADAVLAQLDRALASELKLLQWVASSPSIGSGRLADFEAEAKRAIAVAQDWTSIALIDGHTGGILVDTWPGRPSFLPQISTGIDLASILAQRVPYVSGYVEAGAVSSKAGILLIAPAPGEGATDLVAALIAAPALDAMLQADAKLGDMPVEARLRLVDRAGIILADTLPGAGVDIGQSLGPQGRGIVTAAHPGRFTEIDAAGAEHVVSYAASSVTGWSVLLSLPTGALGGFGRPVLIAAIGGFGAVLLAGLLAILVTRDLGQRRKTDEALQQAQRMELIGQMTGGVAHDFNNLLTVISGNLDLLAPEVETNPRVLRMVRSASRAAERGARLTEQLLAYSRRQRLHPVPVDINQLITEIGELIDRIRGETVLLHLTLADGLWIARVDTLQLQSAILNLVLNAREAMPAGGSLVIRTRNVEAAEASGSGIAGPAVELAVSDTGTGMTPQVAARAFDPFFTTKEVGKGSGLGLSQVFGFVQQSGGRVTIDSEEGAGTTVRILLPRTADQVEKDAPPHPFGEVL
ncbi:MAG TPA: ATP-binding protein [Aliidongia sp.]|nr:ATP-binding protein [Aliidongia sp.]